jgi:hypothetical protein
VQSVKKNSNIIIMDDEDDCNKFNENNRFLEENKKLNIYGQ